MSFSRLTVQAKLFSLVFACFVAVIGYASWSWSTLSIAKVHGPYYNKIVQGKDLIADILPPPNYIIESYLMALHMTNEVQEGVDERTMRSYVDRCEALKSEFDERHAFWVKDLPEGELKRIKTVDCYQPAIEFYQVLSKEFIPACLVGDVDVTVDLSRGVLREHYEVHREAVDRAVDLATKQASSDEVEVASVVSGRSLWSTLGIVGILGFIGSFGWFTARQTVSPLAGSANRLQFLSNHDLTDVSNRLRTNAESTRDQATMASGAAEEVSANAQSLAGAVEQFEASIKEIASNASNAASVARDAVEAAGTTNTTVSRLGESSAEIGNVIKVINSIAEQTNLLALNATIEAARAGEAGKGFAVVANEVKELAKETSKATEDIVGRIGTIQTDTQEAVDAIGLVSEIISQISESQNAIAGAVEEQTAMTSEISRNISEVATGSGEIARSISQVADVARNTTTGSEETMSTAASIESLAMDLLGQIGMSNQSQANTNEATASAAAPSQRGKYQITQDESVFADTL